MRYHVAAAIAGVVLLVAIDSAFAETSATPDALEGSESMTLLVEIVLSEIGLYDSNGIETYNGIGSAAAQRQMNGGTAPFGPLTSEPACTDTNGGDNVGCQEVAPMMFELRSVPGLSEWELLTPCDLNTEAREQAEGIAVCKQSLVVISDNATLGMYGDDASACAAFAALPNTNNAGSPPSFPDRGVGDLADSGILPVSGYALGAGMAAADRWRDVLRVAYTGCLQGDGDCVTATGLGNTSAGVPSRKRTERCNSPVRRELLGSWRYLVEGAACGDLCEVDISDGQLSLPGHRADDGVDDTGLRHAYRPGDRSDTTEAFLELIGVRPILEGRPKITATSLESAFAAGGCSAGLPPATAKLITPIPEQFAFCDGGERENWAPDCRNNTIIPIGGDPIRKNCSEQDDLCGPDQKAAVVQAIKTSRGANQYPTHQCSRGQFVKRNFLASPHNVCPDGSKPSAGQCKLPFFQITGAPATQTLNCLNPFNSRPSTVPGTTDGRAYNIVMRTAAGVVDQPSGNTYEHASWRQNVATMALSGTNNIFGKAYLPADYQCREVDQSRNIGCIVSKSRCSIGVGNREAAFNVSIFGAYHLDNEPFLVSDTAPTNSATLTASYPLSHHLWFNAFGGMELITSQCLARGDASEFCAEQTRLALEFWGAGLAGNVIAEACTDSGFVPLPRESVFCKGPSPFCGAPVTQSMSACIPM